MKKGKSGQPYSKKLKFWGGTVVENILESFLKVSFPILTILAFAFSLGGMSILGLGLWVVSILDFITLQIVSEGFKDEIKDAVELVAKPDEAAAKAYKQDLSKQVQHKLDSIKFGAEQDKTAYEEEVKKIKKITEESREKLDETERQLAENVNLFINALEGRPDILTDEIRDIIQQCRENPTSLHNIKLLTDSLKGINSAEPTNSHDVNADSLNGLNSAESEPEQTI